MFQAEEKFNKEIQALKLLKDSADPLTGNESAVIRQKILKAISLDAAPARSDYFWTLQREKIARFAAATILGLSLLSGTAFAANNSLPGQTLYPLKRIKEKIELSLTVSQPAKANLQADFAQERLAELARLSSDIAIQPAGQQNLPPVSVTAATSSIPALPQQATPTPAMLSPNTSSNTTIEQQARTEANLEVNSALRALQQTEANFQFHGDTQEASSVSQTILDLRSKATDQHIQILTLPQDQKFKTNFNLPGGIRAPAAPKLRTGY